MLPSANMFECSSIHPGLNWHGKQTVMRDVIVRGHFQLCTIKKTSYLQRCTAGTVWSDAVIRATRFKCATQRVWPNQQTWKESLANSVRFHGFDKGYLSHMSSAEWWWPVKRLMIPESWRRIPESDWWWPLKNREPVEPAVCFSDL